MGQRSGTSVRMTKWINYYLLFSYCIFTCVVDMAYMVYFNFFCCFLLSLIAMLFIYGHIFLVIRHQLRRIAVTRGTFVDMIPTVRVSTAKENSECSASEIAGGEAAMATARGSVNLINTETTAVFMAPNPRPGVPIKSKTHIFQEQQKANSLFLLVFLFALCWMPIHLINCVLLFCQHCHVPMSVMLTAILLSHANSALNPVLYVYSMRSFRQKLMKMWKKRPTSQWDSTGGSWEQRVGSTEMVQSFKSGTYKFLRDFDLVWYFDTDWSGSQGLWNKTRNILPGALNQPGLWRWWVRAASYFKRWIICKHPMKCPLAEVLLKLS